MLSTAPCQSLCKASAHQKLPFYGRGNQGSVRRSNCPGSHGSLSGNKRQSRGWLEFRAGCPREIRMRRGKEEGEKKISFSLLSPPKCSLLSYGSSPSFRSLNELAPSALSAEMCSFRERKAQLCIFLANHLAQLGATRQARARPLDAPRLEWRFQDEAAQGRCHRSPPAFWGAREAQLSVQAERLEDPGVAQRPLFSLALQGKHLEHRSKYGHLQGAAGEPRENRPC